MAWFDNKPEETPEYETDDDYYRVGDCKCQEAFLCQGRCQK